MGSLYRTPVIDIFVRAGASFHVEYEGSYNPGFRAKLEIDDVFYLTGTKVSVMEAVLYLEKYLNESLANATIEKILEKRNGNS